jgi:PAS domain S-box-containing protein
MTKEFRNDASIARAEVVFENAAVGIARVAPDGRFMEVNRKLCEILGYTSDELIRKTFSEVTHPEDRDADLNMMRQMLAGESATYLREKRYCRKDGSIVWANLSVALLRKADRTPDCFISVVQDITTRKRAEQKLRESEQRLRLASRMARLGIFEWDMQADRAIWENRRMYEIFNRTRAAGGLSRAELIEEYVEPEDAPRLEQALAQGLETGHSFQTVFRIRGVKGGTRWLDLAAHFGRMNGGGARKRMIGVLADVTERQQIQETLRASEERFRLLADTAPVLIWSSGTDKRCTFFTKPWLDFTGRSMEQELGFGWAQGIHPEDYARCVEGYTASFQARRPFEIEYRLKRFDGQYRWVFDRGIPRFSSEGAFLGYIGSCIDITERKEVEAALRASESRFRQLVESLPQLVWTCQADGSCDYVSPQWVAYTGIPETEQFGRGWLNQLHPDDRPAVIAAWKGMVSNGLPFDVELRIRRSDGVYRWFKTQAVALRDSRGEIVKWLAANMDIDDQKQAEHALRESNQRLAGIVASAMDAIITVDDHQRIVLFNQAAEQMFGCTAAEALGQPVDRFIPERFRAVHAEHLRRVGETAETSRVMGRFTPLAALRADGTEFPIEASASTTEVGGRKLYTVIHRDITERKRAEMEREELAREQVARMAAEAANRAKDDFLAMVSHELRSPLNAIFGYTSLLRSGAAGIDVETATRIIERSAKTQLQIIEDLLDSARIIAGKLRIEPARMDLVPVLEAALDTVRPVADAKKIRLIASFSRIPVQVLGDPTGLQQVVWNLLTNAVKFTGENGQVELRLDSDPDTVRITVRDTGRGIDPEFLPFVFDRFRQAADTSAARRHGGLGLGLSIAKHIVELHGGTITAASEGLGRGSTFTVTLPPKDSP